MEETGLDRILGETRATGVRLANGTELPADFVIVGVGILPGTGLAAAAGIAIDNGIACDACCRTSAPHVWAAGDCASFPWKEGRLRLESVGNAIDMAEAVAENIMGADTMSPNRGSGPTSMTASCRSRASTRAMTVS